MPTVGIGLPTYNRSALLGESLLCLREQTSSDFEALVLDNASSDDTAEVFQSTVGKDSRFRYRKQEATVPPLRNFLDALHLVNTDYFMWRADDDLSSPNFIARLSEGLDRDPTAELAVTPVERWKLSSNRRDILPLPPFPSPDQIDRTIHLLHNKRPTWVYGLWRRTALQRNLAVTAERYPYLWASDHLMMMPTVLKGRVAFADDALFIQRILGRESYELPTVERLKARALYASICADLIRDIAIPPDRMSDVLAALEFHYDDRVGPLKRLKRRLMKERALAAVGFKWH